MTNQITMNILIMSQWEILVLTSHVRDKAHLVPSQMEFASFF